MLPTAILVSKEQSPACKARRLPPPRLDPFEIKIASGNDCWSITMILRENKGMWTV